MPPSPHEIPHMCGALLYAGKSNRNYVPRNVTAARALTIVTLR